MKMPGAETIELDAFLDLVRRVGHQQLQDLIALWLDQRFALLLGLPPNDPETGILLAKTQGVREFARWVVDMTGECEERKQRKK